MAFERSTGIYWVPTASHVLLHMLGTYGGRHSDVPAPIQKSTFQFWPVQANPALSACDLAWSLNVTINNKLSANTQSACQNPPGV